MGAKKSQGTLRSDHAPAVPEAHLVVGFDGSPPATRALDVAVRLLTVRPGRITVLWVAHLASTIELSADAVAIVVGSSASAMHRMVGSVAVNLARHAPVPVTIVP